MPVPTRYVQRVICGHWPDYSHCDTCPLTPLGFPIALRTSPTQYTGLAVSRPPLAAETQVRSPVSPCRICGGQSGTGTGFSPSTSVFPCQFRSTGVSITRKNEKKLIIFITGLHNKLQGCGASVTSAAGPFTTKRNSILKSVTNTNQICCAQHVIICRKVH
jgi:hypothetical protein